MEKYNTLILRIPYTQDDITTASKYLDAKANRETLRKLILMGISKQMDEAKAHLAAVAEDNNA